MTIGQAQDRLNGLDRNSLLSRLEEVLTFAISNLELVNPNEDQWQEDSGYHLSLADKVFIESALLLLVATRVSYPSRQLECALRDVARFLSRRIRSDRNRVLLLRFPNTALALGIGHLALTQLGDHDKEFHDLVLQAFDSGQVEASERLPYRVMDLRWLRQLLKPGERSSFEDLYPHSILASRAHPIYMSPSDTYALTHAVMYVTDFGRHPLPVSLNVTEVRTLVDACLACHLVDENLDLLGELVISSVIIGPPWSPYAEQALCVLLDVWERLGFLPSPTFTASVYAELPRDTARSYVFRHSYHTMFVAGILCAIILTRMPETSSLFWSPPTVDVAGLRTDCVKLIRRAEAFCTAAVNTPASEDRPLPSRAKPVLVTSGVNFSLPGKVRPNDIEHLVEFEKMHFPSSGASSRLSLRAVEKTGSSPDALALVITDGLLIRAIKEYKLGTLAHLLQLISQLNIPPSKTFSEALIFLKRQQLASGAIGAPFLMTVNREVAEAVMVTSAVADCLTAVSERLTFESHQMFEMFAAEQLDE